MIILDTNVLDQIARGNVQAAEALKRQIASGKQVYIARAAYDELVKSPPSAALRDGYRALLKDLNIPVAPKTSVADRGNLYADNIQYKPKHGMPGQITEYGKGAAKAVPGDVFVAAEAKSLKASLWTFDKDLAKRARNMGVFIAQESSIAPVSGTEDIKRARRLLGLRSNFSKAIAKLSNIKVKISSIKLAGSGRVVLKIAGGLGLNHCIFYYWRMATV